MSLLACAAAGTSRSSTLDASISAASISSLQDKAKDLRNRLKYVPPLIRGGVAAEKTVTIVVMSFIAHYRNLYRGMFAKRPSGGVAQVRIWLSELVNHNQQT
jgi:hypothetical protein